MTVSLHLCGGTLRLLAKERVLNGEELTYRNDNEKKRSDEMQTLRAGCNKAETKIFAPPQTPFPEARDGQNLISWRRSLPSPTNPVW